jgi:hypothetical protein
LVSSWSISFLPIAMGSPIFFFPWPFTQFYLHPRNAGKGSRLPGPVRLNQAMKRPISDSTWDGGGASKCTLAYELKVQAAANYAAEFPEEITSGHLKCPATADTSLIGQHQCGPPPFSDWARPSQGAPCQAPPTLNHKGNDRDPHLCGYFGYLFNRVERR